MKLPRLPCGVLYVPLVSVCPRFLEKMNDMGHSANQWEITGMASGTRSIAKSGGAETK